VAFSDLYALPTLASIKESTLAIAASAGLTATAWILGEPSERWIEIVTRVTNEFASTVTTQAVRMFFLELATDPGDPGDLSKDQTPRPGWLSALGASWYGVERGGQTYATGSLILTNAGTTSATFAPFDLTFVRTALPARADGGQPTYRNSADPTIYTGPGGTLTLAPGASATIPVVAEQIGSYGSASGGDIASVVTQSFGTLTCSNPSAAIGADREAKALYIARCRIAGAKLSPGGPGAAYRYAANTARDGSPLQRFDGSGPVGITETFVSADSETGKVTLYYRDPDGPASAIDVSSATANTTGIPLGVITDPLGVLPDGITILPTVTDPNTGGPGGAAAIATNISLAGTAKVKVRPGGLSGLALIAVVQAAIAEQLDATTFPSIPIGGVDQVAGAGVVYTSDLQDDIRDAYDGLYAVNLTLPATSTTAILLGHVAVRVAPPAITGAVASAGLIKITAPTNALSTGNQTQIFGVLGTTEANGTWTVTVVDANSFTLDGSVFTNAYTSGGTISRIVITVVP